MSDWVWVDVKFAIYTTAGVVTSEPGCEAASAAWRDLGEGVGTAGESEVGEESSALIEADEGSVESTTGAIIFELVDDEEGEFVNMPWHPVALCEPTGKEHKRGRRD